MWRIAGVAGLVAAALALGAHVGCSNQAAGVSCSPGTMVVCSCNGSLTGQTPCDSSGHETNECICNGDSGGSSGSSSGGGSGSSSGGAEGGTGSGDGGANDGALGG